MTKILSLQLFAALALVCGGLSSCSSTARPDLVNPTAAQLDDMDVQWGLPKRVSRGGPKRFFSSSDPSAPSVSAPVAPSAGGAVDPTVINKLSQ